MPTFSMTADAIVDGWRRSTQPTNGLANPAGDLYASGDFAEADIVQVDSGMAISTTSPCSTAVGRCCC
jgi:hypothetical protein